MQWRQPTLSATVKAFCETCNSGWMSKIEAAAKPIVTLMVYGTAVALDPEAQRTVASWALLKGLVTTQVSKTPQPIPDRHFHRVYTAMGVPTNTALVWIGRRHNLADPTRAGEATPLDAHFMPLTNVARGFPVDRNVTRYISEGGVINATIFQVGHFFSLTLQHDWPGLQMRPKPTTVAAIAFTSIWPARATASWPPLQPVDGLGNLHRVTEFFELRGPTSPVFGP